MILDKIVTEKLKELELEKERLPMEILKESCLKEDLPKTKDFYRALNSEHRLSIIGEVKKASPSKGIICENFNPLQIAKAYEENGISCISVLTEKNFFLGKSEYLCDIRKTVSIPILRKDFIIDPWQIYESRILGADAILLIVSILTYEKLKYFKDLAEKLGMNCLIEVHDEEELQQALRLSPSIIGINNRNLNNFETSLNVTEQLIKCVPNDVLVVSESGIKNFEDMNYLQNLGVKAVLIGEALVNNNDIRKKICQLKNESIF